MRKIRKHKGKSENNPAPPQPWEPQQVIERVNRARGEYLRRTGEDFGWRHIAKLCGWEPSTQTDAKKGKRPLRVAEIGVIAARLGVQAGYLAFDETNTREGINSADVHRRDERRGPPDERPNDDKRAG